MICIICNGRYQDKGPLRGICSMCQPQNRRRRPDLFDHDDPLDDGPLANPAKTPPRAITAALLGNGAAHRARQVGMYPDGSKPTEVRNAR